PDEDAEEERRPRPGSQPGPEGPLDHGPRLARRAEGDIDRLRQPRVASLASRRVASPASRRTSGVAPYHPRMPDDIRPATIDPADLPEHVRANREAWDRYAEEYVEPGRRAWSTREVTWGIWGIPETEVHLPPDDVSGQDVVELGCGTGYVSSWLAKRGARPVGIDNSATQLATARRLQREHDLTFPLIHASAEAVPLAGERFDLALSEDGARIRCDPHRRV